MLPGSISDECFSYFCFGGVFSDKHAVFYVSDIQQHPRPRPRRGLTVLTPGVCPAPEGPHGVNPGVCARPLRSLTVLTQGYVPGPGGASRR